MRERGNISLFTVVMNFEGTTSVTQVKASSPAVALEQWLRSLNNEGAYGLTTGQRVRLLDSFDSEVDGPPVPLDGLINAWCATLGPRGALAILNFVRTENQDT